MASQMTKVKLFGGHKSLHASLGGGKVADLLLWKDRRASGAVLAGVALVWFLFEVVEYNFITFICHLLITSMLVLFIWSTGADFLKWTPPRIPRMILQDSTFIETASIFHKKMNFFVSKFIYVACGNDGKLFFLLLLLTSINRDESLMMALFSFLLFLYNDLVMGGLYILSIVGNCISTMNLIFFGLLCLETLPFVYSQYEVEIDDLATKMYKQMKGKYKLFEAEILGRIPHGPVKQRKQF